MSNIVLVTGSASFIGSYVVDTLLAKDAIVNMADDFSSGKLANLEYLFKNENLHCWVNCSLTVKEENLKDKSFASSVMKNVDDVFHLTPRQIYVEHVRYWVGIQK
jgi:nucleoside-diphosphate-sugar epimerase